MDICFSDDDLRRYINGRVSGAEALVRERHLAVCSDCLERLEGLRDESEFLVAALRGLGDGLAPDAFLGRNAGVAGGTAVADPVAQAPTRRVIRDYSLLRILGRGGMGEVYLALHVRLDKHVALKCLRHDRCEDRESIARFEREMKLVGKLEHDNIVRALDAGEENGTYFLVMEYVDGFDLARLSRSLRGLPVAAACELVRQAAEGLQHAHENGLIHRDVKPSNLMLSSRRQVKVLDLGLAQFARSMPLDRTLTGTAQVLGTLAYMSPEQCQGRSTDVRSDIYSLGVTLFELLVGTLPPGANRPGPAFPKIGEARPDVPKPVQELLEAMLSENAAARPKSMGVVVQALQAWSRNHDLGSILDRYERSGDAALSSQQLSREPRLSTREHSLTAEEPSPPVPPPLPAGVGPTALSIVNASPSRRSVRRSPRGIPFAAAAIAVLAVLVVVAAVPLLGPASQGQVTLSAPADFYSAEGATAVERTTGRRYPLDLPEQDLPVGSYRIEAVSSDFEVNPTAFTVKANRPTPLVAERARGTLFVDVESDTVERLLLPNSESIALLVAVETATDTRHPLKAGPNALPVGAYRLLNRAWPVAIDAEPSEEGSQLEFRILKGRETHVDASFVLDPPAHYPPIPTAFGASIVYTGLLWRAPMQESEAVAYNLKLTVLGSENGRQWLQVDMASKHADYSERGYFLVDVERYAINRNLNIDRGWLIARSPEIDRRLAPLDDRPTGDLDDEPTRGLVVAWDLAERSADPLADAAAEYELKLPPHRATVQEALALLFGADVPAPSNAARRVREMLPKNVTYERGAFEKLALPCLLVTGERTLDVPGLGRTTFGHTISLNDSVPFRWLEVTLKTPILSGNLSCDSFVVSGDPDAQRTPPTDLAERAALIASSVVEPVPWDLAMLEEAAAGASVDYSVTLPRSIYPVDLKVRVLGREEDGETVWIEVDVENPLVGGTASQSALLEVDLEEYPNRFVVRQGWFRQDGFTLPFPAADDDGVAFEDALHRLKSPWNPLLAVSVFDAIELLFDAKHNLSQDHLRRLRDLLRSQYRTADSSAHVQSVEKTDPDGIGIRHVEVWESSFDPNKAPSGLLHLLPGVSSALALRSPRSGGAAKPGITRTTIERCREVTLGFYSVKVEMDGLGETPLLSAWVRRYEAGGGASPDLAELVKAWKIDEQATRDEIAANDVAAFENFRFWTVVGETFWAEYGGSSTKRDRKRYAHFFETDVDKTEHEFLESELAPADLAAIREGRIFRSADLTKSFRARVAGDELEVTDPGNANAYVGRKMPFAETLYAPRDRDWLSRFREEGFR